MNRLVRHALTFYTTFDPKTRGYLLEVALDLFPHCYGPEDLGCEEAYMDVVDTAETWFGEWFFDMLPDEAGEREPTREEEDYVVDMAQDFSTMLLEDITDAADMAQTLASLPR